MESGESAPYSDAVEKLAFSRPFSFGLADWQGAEAPGWEALFLYALAAQDRATVVGLS